MIERSFDEGKNTVARPIITLPIVKAVPSGGGSPINVTIEYTGIVYSRFYTIAAVPHNTTVDLMVYLVPIGKFDGILRVDVSGQNTAVYDIIINGAPAMKIRTSYFNTFSATEVFGNGPSDALTLNPGDEIKVRVTNLGAGASDFESRIQYLET